MHSDRKRIDYFDIGYDASLGYLQNPNLTPYALYRYDLKCFAMDYFGIFLVFFRTDPHLHNQLLVYIGNTFLNVPKPARIEPPIHVVYFRSGGA